MAIQCVASILSQLPLDTVENVLLPFALECTVDAVNGNNGRACGGGGSEKLSFQTTFSPTQDISCLIPSYLIEFDFFLSQGEPVISLCCEFFLCLNWFALIWSYICHIVIKRADFIIENS